jgi:hypothetical protein
MFKKLLFIFLLLPGLCSALPHFRKKAKAAIDSLAKPPLTRKDVIAIGDSLMSVYLGDLYSSCTYNKKGYYSYIDSNTNQLHWTMLSKHKTIKAVLKNVFMSYTLDHDYPNCNAYSKIKGVIYLKLDSNLAPTGKPDMSFIPDFVWKGEKCHLCSKDKAISLAYDFGFKEGTQLDASIEYDRSLKQFYWTITNRIPQDSTIQKRFVTQTMQLNAYTRKKISYSKTGKQPHIQH